MFNARNLNSLYSRFDQKCYRVLDGKTPKVCNISDTNYLPYGVVYEYTNDPATSFYVGINSTSQSDIEIELSKLEVKHLDVAGGQVYLDKYIGAGDTFSCNLNAIQKSFELHRRTIGGIEYDVHIGWDSTDASLTSYARQYFDDLGDSPTLPPGRIHKHKIAVADIFCENIGEFRILNTYQRYDCWRVHNCCKNTLTVFLQHPDGSSQRESVAPMGCRSFRRRADGTWATTWPDGSLCTYFFPYFKGDVPYFAGGPPLYNYIGGSINYLENSAEANNIANPFLLTQWMRCLNAWLDPFIPLDIRSTYPDTFADPENANTVIGDLIFTWGRARVQVIKNYLVVEDYYKIFRGSTSFLEDLESIGLNVAFDGIDIDLSTKYGDTTVFITPMDCNVFALPVNGDYGWTIVPAVQTVSTTYPDSYFVQDPAAPTTQKNWIVGNEPSWLETVRTLRRRIAVEEGFLNSYDDVVDIPEEKVGKLALTPLGIVGRAATSVGIETWDANSFSELVEYERTANIAELRTQYQPANFGSGSYANFPYVSAIRTYFLQSVNLAPLGYVFPQIQTLAGSRQAIQCAYIPPGGPWGFSSSVYDENLTRCWNETLVTSIKYGSDFWINKWGGPAGIDASVRILGQPNQTAWNDGTIQDVIKPQNNPQMAYLLESQYAILASDYTDISKIIYLKTPWFQFDREPLSTAELGSASIYHKIPKSAWLWNLLEYQVRAWTRAVPLAHGEEMCPIWSFNAGGALVASTVGSLLPKDLWVSCIDDGYASIRVSEAVYDSLIANGIQARNFYAGAPFDHYYYSVRVLDLAAYCGSKGFNSYNFDCLNQTLDADEGIIDAATKWLPYRAYGPGEQTEIASYYDVANAKQLYRAVRFVDLRLPNELSA